jgi:hypothetical protein
MWSTVLYLVLPVVGGTLIVGLGSTALVGQTQRWWRITLGTALASGVINGAVALRVSDPLYRDIAAVAIISALCPVAVAATVRSMRGREGSERVWGGISVVLVFLVGTPFLLLYAHCTSGDCL